MSSFEKESAKTLITKSILETKPSSIIQIGTGSFEYTQTVVESVAHLPGTQLTLLVSPADKENLERLQAAGLDNWDDYIESPADQVLPDFYFQEHVFDMAIMHPSVADEAMKVAFYYAAKLLGKGDKLIVSEEPHDGQRPLCRHVLATRHFEVAATSEIVAQMSFLEKTARARYERLPNWLRDKAELLINPSLLETDAMLGLAGNVVVFSKMEERAEREEQDIDVDAMIEAMID